jgi:flagellar basal-body rod protein FlgB
MLENGINPLVEKMLDFTARRQQTISSNLANLDTPGYQAKDIQFHDALSTATSSIEELEVDDANVKANGNNVDLEKQMTQMTQNGLQYMLLVEYLRSDIQSIKTAITEGGKP